jgi:hypothetical protein
LDFEVSSVSVPVASFYEAEQFWDANYLGVSGDDLPGSYIGFAPAKKLLGIGNWYPFDGYKHALVGTQTDFGINGVNFILFAGDEYDYNLVLRPDIPRSWILRECPGWNDSTPTLEAEVTPCMWVDSHRDLVFARGIYAGDALNGERVGVYGAWVDDSIHRVTVIWPFPLIARIGPPKPEIHPADLIWHVYRHTDSSGNMQIDYELWVFQDASRRFDDSSDFDYSHSLASQPWAAPPIWARFRIPFYVNASRRLNYTISPLFHRSNVSSSLDGDAFADDDDGSEHKLVYDGMPLINVIENNPDGDIGVRFTDLRQLPAPGSSLLIGYLQLRLAIGAPGDGNQGYYYFLVHQTLASTTVTARPAQGGTRPKSDPPPIVLVGQTVPDSLNLRTNLSQQPELLGDLAITIQATTNATSADVTITNVTFVVDGVPQSAPFAVAGPQSITVSNLPVLHEVRVQCFTASGLVQASVWPGIVLTTDLPRIDSYNQQAAPKAWLGFAQWAGLTDTNAAPPALLAKNGQVKLALQPTYTMLKNGVPALEEDGEFIEEIWDALAATNTQPRLELFGSDWPFTVTWSFSATNEAGAQVPVVFKPAVGEQIEVSVTPPSQPDPAVTVTFPSNSVPGRLYALSAEATIRDSFGATSSATYVLYSHELTTTNPPNTLSDAVVSRVAQVAGEDPQEVLRAGDLSELPPDDPRIEDPRHRRARILRGSVLQAAEDSRITVPELAEVVDAGQRLAALRYGPSVGLVGDDLTTTRWWRTANVPKANDSDGDNIYGTVGYYLARTTEKTQPLIAPFLDHAGDNLLTNRYSLSAMPKYITGLFFADPTELGASGYPSNSIPGTDVYGTLDSPLGANLNPISAGTGLTPREGNDPLSLVLRRTMSPNFRLTLFFGNRAGAFSQMIGLTDGGPPAAQFLTATNGPQVVYASWNIKAGTNDVAIQIQSLDSGPSRLAGLAIDILTNTCTLVPSLVIGCPSNIVVECQNWAGTVVNFSFTASNLCNPADLSAWSVPPSGSSFPSGTTTVDCYAAGNGQVAHCAFTVTVGSNCPPCIAIACPTNMTLDCADPIGTVATYSVTASNLCNPELPVVTDCLPPSGTRFPPGTWTVNCAAWSLYGTDFFVTNGCSFTVTVRSNCPPGFAANLLVYDSFEYPTNTKVVGQNGGSGWTGPWFGLTPIFSYFTNQPGSLVPSALPQYPTAGGSAAIDLPPSSGSYLNRSLDLATTNANELWFSAVLVASGGYAEDRLFLYFDDNNQTGIEIGAYAPGTSYPVRWTIQQSTAMGPIVQSNQPTLLVLQITNLSLTSHLLKLYVNPPVGLKPPVPDATLLYQGPRLDRIKSVYYVVSGGGTHHVLDEIRFGANYSGVNSVSGLLSAQDDTFVVGTNGPVVIPISALLANDTQSQGLPLYLSSHDAATTLGQTITDVGSPVSALSVANSLPRLPGSEDTFTYRTSDGTQQAVGTVHLVVVAAPQVPAPNKLAAWTFPNGGGLTLPFNAPAAGTYVLERVPLAALGQTAVWKEVTRATLVAPGVTIFTDAVLPSGALYRVRTNPP